MKKSWCMFTCMLFVIGLSSCGGGSGGGGAPVFAGQYRVALSILSDSCNLGLPSSLSTTQTVNQDGEKIVLDSGSTVFTGSVNDEQDGFIVTNQTRSDNCVTRSGFNYKIGDIPDADYSVAYLIQVTCGRTTCESGYGGTARSI